MKKLSLLFSFIIVPIFYSYSQSKEDFEVLMTPIGRSYIEISEAAKNVGYITVNHDTENGGKTESYIFTDKSNPTLGCELKFYSESKRCFTAAFNFPLSMWDVITNKLDQQGERQGVYNHWKFLEDKYEVNLSKDTDNDLLYIYFFRLRS